MDVNEFEESEVMFSDYYSSSDQSVESDDDHERVVDDGRRKHNMGRLDGCKTMLNRRKNVKKMHKIRSSSLPIHIPNNSFRYDSDVASPKPFDDDDDNDGNDGDDDDDQMLKLPPHLIVERRRATRELARSFPMKERNLYHVRNCIIRMNDGLL